MIAARTAAVRAWRAIGVVAALAAWLIGGAAPAGAQTVSVSLSPVTSTVDLGKVAEGSAATTFTVDPGGTVTRSPNDATGHVPFGGTIAPPQVTISCTAGCNGNYIRVRIILATTSSARYNTVSWYPGAAVYTGSMLTAQDTSIPDNILLTVRFTAATGNIVFKLGHIVTVTAPGTTGTADLNYRISTANGQTSTPSSTGGTAGTLRATIYRGLSITTDTNLKFGKIVRPATGSGTVTINTTTGARTFTGNVILVNDVSTDNGQFTTSRQGSTGITLSLASSTITLNGPAGATLSLALTSSGIGSTTLSAGTPGTKVSYLGGTLTIANTTPTGVYSGTISLTAAYN